MTLKLKPGKGLVAQMAQTLGQTSKPLLLGEAQAPNRLRMRKKLVKVAQVAQSVADMKP